MARQVSEAPRRGDHRQRNVGLGATAVGAPVDLAMCG